MENSPTDFQHFQEMKDLIKEIKEALEFAGISNYTSFLLLPLYIHTKEMIFFLTEGHKNLLLEEELALMIH